MDQADDIQTTRTSPSSDDTQQQRPRSLGENPTKGSLRKQCKRLQTNRKILKEKNDRKSAQIKALRGGFDDLRVSRDLWKNQYKESEAKIICLNEQIRKTEDELNKEREKIKAQENLFEIEHQLRLNTEKARDEQIGELKKKLMGRIESSQIPNQGS
jgi:predicted  nucleic acid-binding Zn-ribbon protein